MSKELAPKTGQFDEIISIIDNARTRAMKAVNAELIQMYWEIGAYVSERVKDGGWGKSIVADFSAFLQTHYPTVKGFSAQNIWRMKQFYETYCDNEKLSPLVREIPWTNNLLIMTGCKTDEAREFYLRLCIANRYTKRELDRQIGSMLYERTMLSDAKHKELVAGNGGLAALRDSYVFEFLDLNEPYKEKDLRRQIVSHLKDFILEFGHDFTKVQEIINSTAVITIGLGVLPIILTAHSAINLPAPVLSIAIDTGIIPANRKIVTQSIEE